MVVESTHSIWNILGSVKYCTIECKGFESSITPHTPCTPSKTDQSSPEIQDEQVQLEALQLPDVPTVNNEGYPSSTTRNSYSTPSLTAPSSSPSTLSGPAPPSQIYENHPGKVFTPLTGNVAAQNLDSSTSTHISEARESGNFEDNVKDAGVNGQGSKEAEAAVEGDGVPVVPCVCPRPTRLTSVRTEAAREPITVSARTSFLSTASRPTSTAPSVSNSAPNLHGGSMIPFTCSFANARSWPPIHLSQKRRRTRPSVLFMPYRQSITSIEDQLRTLFLDHPTSHIDDSGEPAIPTHALVDISHSLGVANEPLLSEDEVM